MILYSHCRGKVKVKYTFTANGDGKAVPTVSLKMKTSFDNNLIYRLLSSYS